MNTLERNARQQRLKKRLHPETHTAEDRVLLKTNWFSYRLESTKGYLTAGWSGALGTAAAAIAASADMAYQRIALLAAFAAFATCALAATRLLSMSATYLESIFSGAEKERLRLARKLAGHERLSTGAFVIGAVAVMVALAGPQFLEKAMDSKHVEETKQDHSALSRHSANGAERMLGTPKAATPASKPVGPPPAPPTK